MVEKLNRIINPKMREMSEEAKKLARQHIRDCHEKYESGMLTYEDAEPVKVHAPRVGVEIMPVRRKGFFGRIMDRIFGPVMKPQAVMVLTKQEQELLKKYMENPEKVNAAVNACTVTAEDIKEATDRLVVLARGHHIRNADGTVTDDWFDTDKVRRVLAICKGVIRDLGKEE